MKPKQRWLLLGSLLLVSLLAAVLVDDAPAAKKSGRNAKAKTAVAGKTAERHPLPRGETLAALPLEFPEPVAEDEAGKEDAPAGIDPFRSKSWYIAPPPPPPVKPKAPPLPFQYLGKLLEDGETRVFLGHQGKHLIARVGDVIDGTYLVEEVSGSRMRLLYQPLNESQILAIGSEK